MIIDTGIDVTHSELQQYIDFEDVEDNDDYEDNYPVDKGYGHGTHIAGLITNGVCEEVKVYACRLGDSINCFQRALDEDFDFINMSGGGKDRLEGEIEIMTELNTKGVVITVSAGNDHTDLNKKCSYYPACYHTELNHLFVASNVDKTGALQPSSNYATWTIPEMGVDIISTYPHNRHIRMTGTSQSSAILMNKKLKELCQTMGGRLEKKIIEQIERSK